MYETYTYFLVVALVPPFVAYKTVRGHVRHSTAKIAPESSTKCARICGRVELQERW